MGSAVLPADSQARKDIPIVSGVLDYFPAALAAVAAVSKAGNDKHNPGQPLHWARGKSTDQADSLVRHLLERGTVDPDTGQRHSALVAWRALALLQTELEEAGLAPLARGARAPEDIEAAREEVSRFEHDGPLPSESLLRLIEREPTEIGNDQVSPTQANEKLLAEEGYEYSRGSDTWVLR